MNGSVFHVGGYRVNSNANSNRLAGSAMMIGFRSRTVYMNRPIKYLFIDGAYFEGACSSMLLSIIDSQNIFDVIDLSRISAGFDRTFYYDAFPDRNDPDFSAKNVLKEALFDRINLLPNWRAHYGTSRNRNRKRGTEQKGVDVLLAIEVFQHAVSGNMDVASILTGDLDFFPLFEALVQTPVKTELLYYPKSISKDLMYSAGTLRQFRLSTMNQWLVQPYNERFRCQMGPGSKDVIGTGRPFSINDQKFSLYPRQSDGNFVALREESNDGVQDDYFYSCAIEEVLLDLIRREHNDAAIIYA